MVFPFHPKTDKIIELSNTLIAVALSALYNKEYSFKSFCFFMLDEEGESIKQFLKPLYWYLYNLPEIKYEQQFMEEPEIAIKNDIDYIIDEWKNNFRLEKEDYYAIDICTKIMYRLLKINNLTPQTVKAIGNYLEAVKALPIAIPNKDVNIEITVRSDSGEYSGSETYAFRINEEFFHIDISGIERGPFGSDSYDKPSWYVGKTGSRNCDLELAFLESEIEEVLNLNFDISGEDYSE